MPRPRPPPAPPSRFLSFPTPPPSPFDSNLNSKFELPGEAADLNSSPGAHVPLDEYVYSPLADPHLDIRLVELLPGAFGETIRVRIRHVPLVEAHLKENPRILVKELAESCPEPWSVCRNLEGRALFWRREDDGAIITSWRHPDPDFDAAQYDMPPLEDGSSLQSKFEALSYTWGSGTKCASIVVQGDTVAKLAVTRSLSEALQHLRDSTQSRMMWIDAICLNQEDKVEKGLQLPRMRDIYRLAYRVVVWLGSGLNQKDKVKKAHKFPRMRDIYRLAYRIFVWLGLDSENSELGRHWERDRVLSLVFNELEYIAAQVEVSEDGTSLWPAPNATEKDWYWSDDLRESASQDYQLTLDGLKQLLLSQWFRRLWVVQEIQLANKRPGPIMQCGSHTISLSKFHRAVTCLGMKTAKRNNYLRKTARDTLKMLEWPVLNATRLLHPMSGVNHKIILGLNWNRKCHDDRDRVYGLLGLTSRQFSDQIPVRYDNPTADVYKDYFLRHSRLAGRLDLLIDHQSTHGNMVKFPTWVPDWSARRDCRTYVKTQFSAYNTRAQFKHNTNSPDILEVRGMSCSVVKSLVKQLPLQDEGSPWKAVHIVRSWQPPDFDTAKYLPTGEPLRTAYALTLLQADVEDRWPSFQRGDLATQMSCGGTVPLVRAHVHSPSSPEAWAHQDYDRPTLQKWLDQDYDHSLFERRPRVHTSEEVPLTTTPHSHITRALNGLYGRCFFRTQEGYMGLAPRDTREGDIIAILLGCLNPVILRPVRQNNEPLSSGSNFEYVGECFVHGLQDSTWLLGSLPHPWKSCTVRCPGLRLCLGFKNTETGVETLEDPRLEAMDAWERLCPEEGEIEQYFPFDYCVFRNKETGEVVTYDPRLEPAELEARGVELSWFSLI